MDILFTNATILPMTAAGGSPKTFTGFVGVAGSRIALVTASASEADAFRAAHPDARIIDCTGRLLMPGLVNTHCHAAMTLQRSYADDIALMEWLNDYIWPFEARQTADDVALGMTLGIVEMLLGGVTSFVDMYYHENRCVEVARRLGIRAMLGCNYFDNNVDEVLPEAEKAVALAADCDRIQIALAPHSPYTVSPENLRRGKELARKWGLHFMTHIAETQDEVRIVREKYGMTPVEHLDALGMLDARTIGAHCIHLTDTDIATLAARGVAVSHNPQSNMKISSGVAPVERLRAAGALVTIGTDGTCSNNDLDMFEEVRTAAFLQKSEWPSLPFYFMCQRPEEELDAFAVAYFLVIVSVAISVSITVTVAIPVSISVTAGAGAVQNDAHVVELLLAVEPLDVGQLAPVEHALAYDVYTEVRKPVGDNCVGHRHGGRTVEEDIIVSAAHFGDEFVEFVRKEHLRRVGRLHSCVNHVEILVESGVLDHALHIGNRSCEIARDAGFAVAVAQLGRQGMAAQVEVDDDHLLVGQGERHGQVRRDEGLARMGIRRGCLLYTSDAADE